MKKGSTKNMVMVSKCGDSQAVGELKTLDGLDEVEPNFGKIIKKETKKPLYFL